MSATKEKNFDQIIVHAMKLLADDGLVIKFLENEDVILHDQAFVPTETLRRLFDAYTEEKHRMVYSREFAEMILLASLESVSVSMVEINGIERECFVGISLADSYEDALAFGVTVLHPVEM